MTICSRHEGPAGDCWLGVSGGCLVGCGSPASAPTTPALVLTGAPTAADVEVREAPPPDRAELTPPASAPSGEPIVISWRDSTVGETRTRDVSHRALYSNAWGTDRTRQRTVRHFRVAERSGAVAAGRPTRLDVTVESGQETVESDGPKRPETLIAGEYRIALVDGRVEVSRAGTGFPIGDREREELEGLYAGWLGSGSTLLRVVQGRSLRVGEVVELSGDEHALAAGGVATFHFTLFEDATTDETVAEHGAKVTLALEVATGRIAASSELVVRSERSPSMTSTTRRLEDATLTD